MTEKGHHVYVVQGPEGARLLRLPVRAGPRPGAADGLPFMRNEGEMIDRMRHFAALSVERVSLEALAERVDYVSVHTLLNAETRHLLGEKFFRRMKPTAILINTSRGPVVDETALARVLTGQRPLNVVNPEVYAPGAARRAR